jgi:hypothetical protein
MMLASQPKIENKGSQLIYPTDYDNFGQTDRSIPHATSLYQFKQDPLHVTDWVIFVRKRD